MLKKLIMICAGLFFAVFCFGQTNFLKGEDLFLRNKPGEAVVFLENALIDDPANITACLYLGVAYEQLQKTDEAIAVYRRGLPGAGNFSANIANNLGNVYFQKGDMEMAEQFFSQAIGFNPVYSRAYLGRANTRIKAGNLRTAVADYEQYLGLEPRSAQRAEIEKLMALIRSEFAAEERKRLLALEEERRIAEERKKLLDSVSASLQSAADASQGISSGAESMENYDGEFELH